MIEVLQLTIDVVSSIKKVKEIQDEDAEGGFFTTEVDVPLPSPKLQVICTLSTDEVLVITGYTYTCDQGNCWQSLGDTKLILVNHLISPPFKMPTKFIVSGRQFSEGSQ